MISVKFQTVRAPEWPKWGFVKHFNQRYFNAQGRGLSYLAYIRWREGRNVHPQALSDPSVFKLNQAGNADRPVILTKPLQEWMRNNIDIAARGSLSKQTGDKVWANLTAYRKAYNDNTGREEGYADYILHVNEKAKEGMKWHRIMTNGSTIKILAPARMRGGELVYPFEIMDASDPKTLTMNYDTHWWMWAAAASSTVKPETEGLVNPFPYAGDSCDVPTPFLGYGKVGYVEAGWVDFLPRGTLLPVYPYYMSYATERKWRGRRGVRGIV